MRPRAPGLRVWLTQSEGQLGRTTTHDAAQQPRHTQLRVSRRRVGNRPARAPGEQKSATVLPFLRQDTNADAPKEKRSK